MAKKAISTEQNTANIARVLETLGATEARLKTLHEHYSDALWHQSTAPGQRTPMETLAHLVHCEERTRESICAALILHEPLVLDIHPERQWGKLIHYETYMFEELLSYFVFRRKVLLRVLSSLSDEQWSRTIHEAGKQRRETVYLLARTQALHEAEHLAELETQFA